MKNTRFVIGGSLIISGAIAMLVAVIKNMVFRFQNPDMTDMRVLIENPVSSTIGLIAVVVTLVGMKLLDY